MTQTLTASALSETVREWLPVATIADLRLLADPNATRFVEVLGYYAKGDGGGGPFYWDDSSSATDNGGTIIAPDAGGTGRWRRVETQTISALQFGCRSSADSQTAFDSALLAAAGNELLVDTTVRLDTGASVIPDGTVVRFLGKDASIDYRGTGAALEIRNSKNIALYDPRIDLTNSGSGGKGLWVRGCWFLNIYNPKVIQNHASHIGIHIETSQTGGNEWGSYLIEIHNPQFHRASSTSGDAGLKTGRTSGDTASVTHLNVYGGWSKGNAYGMYLRQLSGGNIIGFAADTGTDGINIDDSGQVVLMPGELGGSITGYSVNLGSTLTAVRVIDPNLSATGSSGYSQLGSGQTPLSVLGISGTTTPARNLRGFAIISDAATTSAVSFPVAEPNNTYFVVCSIAAVTGAVAAGSLNAYVTNKATSGFTLNLEAAPGAGTSVQVNWIMIR